MTTDDIREERLRKLSIDELEQERNRLRALPVSKPKACRRAAPSITADMIAVRTPTQEGGWVEEWSFTPKTTQRETSGAWLSGAP
jgi:hypothetical protein